MSTKWFPGQNQRKHSRFAPWPRTNIQDLTLVHLDKGIPCSIGRNVSVGHACILHGCTIEDDVLVGMGATVLNKAAQPEPPGGSLFFTLVSAFCLTGLVKRYKLGIEGITFSPDQRENDNIVVEQCSGDLESRSTVKVMLRLSSLVLAENSHFISRAASDCARGRAATAAMTSGGDRPGEHRGGWVRGFGGRPSAALLAGGGLAGPGRVRHVPDPAKHGPFEEKKTRSLLNQLFSPRFLVVSFWLVQRKVKGNRPFCRFRATL